MKQKQLITIISSIILFTTMAFVTKAQVPQQQGSNIDVSDKEIQTFVNVNREMQPQQKEVRSKQKTLIQESSLGMKEYVKLARGQDKPDKEQKKALKELNAKMKKIYKQYDEQLKEKLEDFPITYERFNEIRKASRQDKELQKRMQEAAKQGQSKEQQGQGE